ncbi:putative MFS-type transporter YbcL [Cohnella xylanilytica]|uniref:MFS transporter n=1 Tax=Cohnella xylanilytica TaxID=557555 RepID=UPI001B1A97BF|nr:MFS transporter [Cohnella xylanilytica]GIO15182.1 putative MFS-type transporter YbcL [Cohnella xylanilytica]
MKQQVWKIYMLALVSFLVGTSEFIIAGILDKVAEDAGVSVSAAGQLITVFSLAYAIGTPIVMAATAKMDRRKLLLYSLGFFIVGNAATLLLPGFGFLMVSRAMLAIGTGAFVVTALTVASKLAPADRQAGAIATVITGFSTALIVGVPVGRVVAAAYDWKMTFWGIGILSLLAMFAIAKTIPQTEGDEPIPLGRQIAMLKQPKIAIALGVTFFWIMGYSVVYTYISPFLLDVSGLSESEVSIGLFAFGLASLVGSKIGGFSTDRFGVARTLVIGMSVHALSLVLLSTVSGSAAVVLPLLIVWSLSAWSSGPTQQFNLISLAPAASGIMLSLNTSAVQFGMAAGAGIGGVVAEGSSLSAIAWIGAAGVAVAAAAAAASFGGARIASRRRERAKLYSDGGGIPEAEL